MLKSTAAHFVITHAQLFCSWATSISKSKNAVFGFAVVDEAQPAPPEVDVGGPQVADSLMIAPPGCLHIHDALSCR